MNIYNYCWINYFKVYIIVHLNWIGDPRGNNIEWKRNGSTVSFDAVSNWSRGNFISYHFLPLLSRLYINNKIRMKEKKKNQEKKRYWEGQVGEREWIAGRTGEASRGTIELSWSLCSSIYNWMLPVIENEVAALRQLGEERIRRGKSSAWQQPAYELFWVTANRFSYSSRC